MERRGKTTIQPISSLCLCFVHFYHILFILPTSHKIVLFFIFQIQLYSHINVCLSHFKYSSTLTTYFYLPELHTTRKVWYGESDANNSNNVPSLPLLPPHLGLPSPSLPLSHAPSSPKSFYVIDNFGETDQAIAFSPQSKDVIVGKGVEEFSEADNLPHFWSDWKVSCTPLLHRNWFFSLTPHCINW